MNRLHAILLALSILSASGARAADAVLVLAKRSDADGTSSAPVQEVAEAPSVGLTLGAEKDGRVPVTVPAGSFSLPLIDTEQAPFWLRTGPSVLRLTTPALGHFTTEGDKSFFRLAGTIAVEDANGQLLGEYTVEVNSELPEGYVVGDDLALSVLAKPVGGASTSPPLFSGVVVGHLEEVK